jgi:hypothetical protein
MKDTSRLPAAVSSNGASAGIALGAASRSVQARILGANDRINLAVIGGGRGRVCCAKLWAFKTAQPQCKCSPSRMFTKRKKAAQEVCKGDAYLDYRQILARPDIDGVICNSRPLARQDGNRSHEPGERRLPRKAHDAHRG